MIRLAHFAACLTAALLLLSTAADAQQGWQQLGQITYRAEPQRGVISVANAGRVQAIRIEVQQNDVEISNVRVVFANNASEDFRLGQLIRAGSMSPPIRLPGNRQVRDIIITYVPRGPARIIVAADTRGGPPEPQWAELGCKSIGFLIDRDIIKVGRKEGRFSSLRVRVRGNDIMLFRLGVVYGNGKRDTLDVKTNIKAGSETKPIGLRGENRGIDQIELIYGSRPGFGGKATVCVDGRLAE